MILFRVNCRKRIRVSQIYRFNIESLAPAIHKLVNSDLFHDIQRGFKKVVLKEEDQSTIKEYLKDIYDIELDDEFFDLGNLYTTNIHLPEFDRELHGTEEEKQKKELLDKLYVLILESTTLDLWLKTFDSVKLFPLAIQNTSKNLDQNISVYICVKGGSAVIPDQNLITEDLKGAEGCIAEEGYAKKIFTLPDTGDISDQTSKEMDIPRIKLPLMTSNGYQTPLKDEVDYAKQLQDVFSTPIRDDLSVYRFDLQSLRPGEKSWLYMLFYISLISIIKARYWHC